MNAGRRLLLRQRSRLSSPISAQRTFSRKILRVVAFTGLAGATTAGVGGTILYYNNEEFRHVTQGLKRCAIAGSIGARVAIDYKMTLSKSYPDKETGEQMRKACHKRCAERVLSGLQSLGGVYVKLGQHVSAMVYLLPIEWTSTMATLQDRCEPSSANEIKQLFLTDYGQRLEDIFEEFDWNPLGVASLAQVHKAKLYDGTWVAVKLQHPSLDEFCQIDMVAVSFIFEIIKQVFPEFSLGWLSEEMRESLPKELDFVHEASNARQVEKNFSGERTALIVPKVFWAQRRVMCMEYIDGARVDDLDYMSRHNIDPRQVSSEVTKVFSQMMFLHGFVHCDPHPGNVLVRPAVNPRKTGKNFDLVLLDHGLYRTLPDELRVDYAHLWTAIIKGDETGIRTYAYRVGGTEVYQLLACMLTGRAWDTINAADLNSVRSTDEMRTLSNGALDYLVEVADILAKLPRTVLLLLKTNDLLRHVDETLNVIPDSRVTYLIMGRYCAKAVWLDTRLNLVENIRTIGLRWNFIKKLVSGWCEFHVLELCLWIYQLGLTWADYVRELRLDHPKFAQLWPPYYHRMQRKVIE